MKREILKSQRGVTLTVLIITVILLLIIGATVLYNAQKNTKVEYLKGMYNDIELLEKKVNTYYAATGNLPVVCDEDKQAIPFDSEKMAGISTNPNDGSYYYKIDLSKLDDLSLNYGQEKTSEDIYVINEKSHTIYYVGGIVYNEETYYQYPREYAKIDFDKTTIIYLDANGGKVNPSYIEANVNDEITLPIPTKEYTITYETNGGTTCDEDIVKYTFLGWYTERVGGQRIKNNTTMPEKEMTYYAHWSTLQDTIYLPSTTRTGYHFNGWYRNEDLTAIAGTINKQYKPTKSETLYAKWTAKTVEVTFMRNLNTEDNTSDKQTFTYDISNQRFSDKGWSKVGYTLLGWHEDRTETIQQYSVTSEVSNSWIDGNSPSVTIYAIWKANENTPYTVKHYKMNLDEKTYTLSETENLTGTTDTNVTPNTKTYEGFTAPSTQTVIIKGDGTTVVEYYYTRNSYTLTYDANGGTVDPTSTTAKYEASIILPTPTRSYTVTFDANGGSACANQTASYTFNGWYTAASGGTKREYTKMPAYNETVYAQWTSASITLPTPTRTGYTFNGWYPAETSNNGSGTLVGVGGASYTPSANVTLYAKWTINQYTLTYNANGGTVDPTSTTANYNTAVTLPTPTRSHTVTFDVNGGSACANQTASYTFNGWYTAASGGTKREYTKMPAYNETVYAQWTSASITLPTPTRTGYTFAGWYPEETNNNGSGTIVGEGGKSYTPIENVTLYAKWILNAPGEVLMAVKNDKINLFENITTEFIIEVSGAELTYQWYYNDTAISGATGTSYSIPTTSMTERGIGTSYLGGTYKCIVKNDAGTVESKPVVQTITYTIGNATQMKNFAIRVNNQGITFATLKENGGEVSQIADIDLNSVCSASKGNWTPIGKNTTTNCFFGTFNGNSKKIENLYINTTASNQGLFGVTNNAIIKNVTIESGTITSTGNNIGGIIGFRDYGSIINCINKANVSGNTSVGGIVGQAHGEKDSSGIIKGTGDLTNCNNYGTITGTYQYIGGIAGVGQVESIAKCNNRGIVKGIVKEIIENGETIKTGNTVGGIVGMINSRDQSTITTIKECNNYNSISGNKFIGGIVGVGEVDEISVCNNNGAVSGTYSVGGIAGNCNSSSKDITIGTCTNAGNITSTGRYTGGIVGVGQVKKISNCKNIGNVTGTIYVGGISGISNSLSLTTEIEKCTNGYVDTDGNVVKPTIRGESYIAGIVGRFNCTKIAECTNYGTVIANMTEELPQNAGTTTTEAEMERSIVVVGGIAGIIFDDARDTINTNITISKCTNKGLLRATNTTNENSCYIGGIIGKSGLWDAVEYEGNGIKYIQYCSNYGTIYHTNNQEETNFSYLGGIIGTMCSSTNIKQCYNSGKISNVTTGNAFFGGIAGYVGGIKATQSNIITRSYNVGTLNKDIGKVTTAGIAIKSKEQGNLTYNLCYYLNTTADVGIYNGEGDKTNYVESKTSTYMKGEEFVNKLSSTYWKQDATKNSGYPVLWWE